MKTYRPLPVSFEHGEGAWLWDDQGRKYLDAIAGIAVCGLGHAHPKITAAICDQAGKLIHTSNLYHISTQEQLAERLTRLAGMERVFFGNSGAEANEAAIKLARLYGHKKGIDDPLIVVTDKSFHGRTLATLSASGNRKVQAGFEPLVHGFVRIAYGDIEELEHLAKAGNRIVAVLVEPIQGEGGVNIPPPGYLQGIRQLCDEQDWLLMLDEIQTGMCRTGRWFAHQHERITPEVMTLAKSLGNGVPIGACLVAGKASDLFQPGSHGSTYGGNPLCSRVALSVLEIMQQEKLDQRTASLGETMLSQFKNMLLPLPGVKAIRGQGLIMGIELDRSCGELVTLALAKGLLINVTSDRVVRLLPPLIITEQQATQIVETVCQLITEFLEE